MLERGYAIDVSSIIFWDDKPEEILSESERRRIANAVKSVVKSQWGDATEVHEL